MKVKQLWCHNYYQLCKTGILQLMVGPYHVSQNCNTMGHAVQHYSYSNSRAISYKDWCFVAMVALIQLYLHVTTVAMYQQVLLWKLAKVYKLMSYSKDQTNEQWHTNGSFLKCVCGGRGFNFLYELESMWHAGQCNRPGYQSYSAFHVGTQCPHSECTETQQLTLVHPETQKQPSKDTSARKLFLTSQDTWRCLVDRWPSKNQHLTRKTSQMDYHSVVMVTMATKLLSASLHSDSASSACKFLQQEQVTMHVQVRCCCWHRGRP